MLESQGASRDVRPFPGARIAAHPRVSQSRSLVTAERRRAAFSERPRAGRAHPHAPSLAGRARARVSRAHRALRPGACAPTSRCAASRRWRRRAGGAGNRGGRLSRTAARASVRRQRPALHGTASGRRSARACGPGTCPDIDAAVVERMKRRRRDPHRQGEPARVRQGRHQRLSVRPAAQSLESRAHPVELVERVGHRTRGGLLLGLARRGHRRLDPRPGGGQRLRRPASDVRPREPLRRASCMRGTPTRSVR